MIIDFFRCIACHELSERRELSATGGCSCGAKRFSPVRLGYLGMLLWVIRHPRYVLRALRGEE